jgi:hypothetical protein
MQCWSSCDSCSNNSRGHRNVRNGMLAFKREMGARLADRPRGGGGGGGGVIIEKCHARKLPVISVCGRGWQGYHWLLWHHCFTKFPYFVEYVGLVIIPHKCPCYRWQCVIKVLMSFIYRGVAGTL